MSIIIDGHNLIPKIRGLSLKAMDDEMQLIELLQVYCRVHRKKIEVYFDGAPFGRAGRKRFGLVTAFFIRERIQADDAIIDKLNRSRKNARNWTIVTSDRKILANARALGAEVITAEEFAVQLEDTIIQAESVYSDHPDEIKMSEEEIEEWLTFFNEKKDNKRSE